MNTDFFSHLLFPDYYNSQFLFFMAYLTPYSGQKKNGKEMNK